MAMLQKIYALYENISPSYYALLKKNLKKCKTLIEYGCGYNSPLRYFKNIKKTGIEIHQKTIEMAKKLQTHDFYVKADILEYNSKKRYDCAVALDLIEHLTKKDGRKLLKNMEKTANKIIVFTPNGYLPQAKEYVANNPWQQHLSGWMVTEFKKKGYKVYGVNGLKWLRRENAKIRLKPKIVWLLISEISQWITVFFPELAFQILAVKTIVPAKRE